MPWHEHYDTTSRCASYRVAFYEQIMQRLRALPGVKAVAAVNRLPLGGSNVITGVSVEGSTQPEPPASVDRRVITSEYFRTLGIPVVKGRGFTDSDRTGAPAVAVINQTMARRFWPNDDPIGRRVQLRVGPSGGLLVGAAGVQGMTIVMRTAVPPDRLMSAVRQTGLGARVTSLRRAAARDCEKGSPASRSDPYWA